jgi:hypothetical protein
MMQRLLILFVFFLSTHLLADSPIAEVIAVVGKVSAFSEKSIERALKRADEIFVHDKIVVPSDGKIEIKFSDGGLMTLIGTTEFLVDTYRYKYPGQEDAFSGQLFKGGFRTLSGSIGKRNPSGVQFRTSATTIGLRGTLFEVSVSAGETYASCEVGQITLSNQAGTIVIGQNTSSSFAKIRSSNAIPATLSRRPPELTSHLFAPPPGGLPIGTQRATPVGKVHQGNVPKLRIQVSDNPKGC